MVLRNLIDGWQTNRFQERGMDEIDLQMEAEGLAELIGRQNYSVLRVRMSKRRCRVAGGPKARARRRNLIEVF